MEKDRADLIEFATRKRHSSNVGAHWWSVAYNGAFGGAGVLGAAGAIVAGWPSVLQQAPTLGILAGVASILSFVGGFGGFERKWKANRATRVAMDKILLKLSMSNADLTAIRQEIFDALDKHEVEVCGPSAAPQRSVPPTEQNAAVEGPDFGNRAEIEQQRP